MNNKFPTELHAVFYCKFFKETIMVYGTLDTPLEAYVSYTHGDVKTCRRFRLDLLDDEGAEDYFYTYDRYRKFKLSCTSEDPKPSESYYRFLITDSGKLDYITVFDPSNKTETLKIFKATEDEIL